MRRTAPSRGVIFISVLAVTVVVAMLTAAFLSRSQTTLFGAASYRDGVKAEQAARAGVNHLLTLLDQDRSFGDDVDVQLGEASYSVTFDAGRPHFSVNNLQGTTVAPQASFQGHQVAPHTADLVVVGRCGRSQRAVRAVFHQGISSIRSVAAVGRVSLSGDVVVDGVKTLVPKPGQAAPEPAPGGIFSKHRTDDATAPAIEWSGGTTFELGELSKLETAPAESGLESISTALRTAYPDQILDQGAAEAIPEFDVAAEVAAGMASPPLAGGSVQNGYVTVNGARSHSGDLTVNGDLVLNEGTLYVDGDLTINGGLEGLGGVVVSGTVSVLGGNAVVQTSQPAGVALLAGGDINLQGLDLQSYLTSISSTDPDFSQAVTDLRNGLQAYETLPSSHLWGHSAALAKTRGTPGAVSWISPYPGPDGTFNFADSSGLAPAVARFAKAHALANPTDERAQKTVSAIEELQFFFRHNLHNVRVDAAGEMIDNNGDPLCRLPDYQLAFISGMPVGGASVFNYPPNQFLGMQWDDDGHELATFTHDHLGYGVNLDLHDARRKAFLLYNPADLSWLGQSSFQGIVYARGNVNVDTRFRIIGSLLSLGDVTLTNGSTLIFNEEYQTMLGLQMPLGLAHFEEI